jgi:hypothetical protein
LATSPLRHTTSNFSFQLNIYFHSPYITSSLTRGWVYSLQLLLALASAVILRSDSHETLDHILFPQIRDYPNLGNQVPVFISPRNRVAQLYPRPWVPFSFSLRLAGLRWRYSTPPGSVLICLLLLYSVSISTETPVDHLYPVSMDTSVYRTATCLFPRICLHGNVFADSFPSKWVYMSQYFVRQTKYHVNKTFFKTSD